MTVREQINKDFATHLFIEFFFQKAERGFILEQSGSAKHRMELIESYGVFDGCYEMAKKIASELPRLYNNEKITIELENELIWKAIVFSDDSIEAVAYDADDTVLNNVFNIIRLVLRINPIFIYDKNVVPLIMHELTHTYHDIQMYRNGKSMIDTMDSEKYYDNAVAYHEEYLKDRISNFLYFSNQFERGAYMAQLSGLLKEIDYKFNSISDVFDFVKNTEVYKFYEEALSDAYNILSVKDDKQKQECVKYFNELCGMVFNGFGELHTWLRHRCKSIKRSFERNIPKIVYSNVKMKSFLRQNFVIR